MDACLSHRIETLVLCASAPLTPEEIRHLSWQLADAHIRLVLDTGLTDIAGPRIHTQHMAGLPLIHVSTPRLNRSKLLLKRFMDIAGALTAIIVLAPLTAALAFVVKAHDGGPVLFAQERTGRDGTTFRMLKFRSMYTDAEERKAELMAANDAKGGVLFFMANDPRVTTPGRWMRRLSLDELPQFLNVLKGEMSLVGPRPPLPSEVAQYEEHVHRQLRVKPGITGLWQVSGRDDLDWEQAVRLDLYYVENWSPVQDLIILLRTVKTVLTCNGH
ncbi:Putative colanic biosynthesis UDP-glucose lipid carrier transferase [Kocuria rosea]|nr:Putative colanic biosynthesis UDP-glucose lipid carrier transferase [Kocuria rosea]